jgi:hypothetical protein
MVPNSPILTIYFLLLTSIEGMVIGAVVGWLISFVSKIRPRRIGKNALLGACGFLAGLLGAAYIPWHENTISYHLSGGVQVTSTANFYQHGDRVAVIIAILLPLAFELNRVRMRKRNRFE